MVTPLILLYYYDVILLCFYFVLWEDTAAFVIERDTIKKIYVSIDFKNKSQTPGEVIIMVYWKDGINS